MDEAPTCYRHPDRPTRIACQRCERPICPDCMVPSSVGFQCPECVARGNRETRQHQLPYGGERSRDPRLTTFVLIGMNVLVWALIMATGGNSSRVVDYLALIPGGFCPLPGGEYILPDQVACAEQGLTWFGVSRMPWQLFTAGFTHVQFFHLAVNMFVLFTLGPVIETMLGRLRFLAVYLIALLGGSAFVVLLSEPLSSTVGASGAIYGLMGAAALIALKHKGDTKRILMWIGINVVISLSFVAISWQGHLGGLLFGAAAAAVVIYLPKAQRRLQWPLLAALAVLAAVIAAVKLYL